LAEHRILDCTRQRLTITSTYRRSSTTSRTCRQVFSVTISVESEPQNGSRPFMPVVESIDEVDEAALGES
jgi:hypothetical protein